MQSYFFLLFQLLYFHIVSNKIGLTWNRSTEDEKFLETLGDLE